MSSNFCQFLADMVTNIINVYSLHSPPHFVFMFLLYLVKTSNDFYGIQHCQYSVKIWSFHIPVKVQLSHQILSSITLRVISKRTVHNIKTYFQIVDINSHAGARTSVHAAGQLPRHDMLLQSEHATVRRRFRSATSCMGLRYRHAPVWRSRLYS